MTLENVPDVKTQFSACGLAESAACFERILKSDKMTKAQLEQTAQLPE